MIIDKQRKVIFLHNPKCGGTFLKGEYEKAGNPDTTLFHTTWMKEYNTDPWHITYDLLPRFVPDWKEYRIFVMVRNPYNRFLSATKEARNVLTRNLWPLKKGLRSSYLFRGEYSKMPLYQKFIASLRDVILFKCGLGCEKQFQQFLSLEDAQRSLELLQSMTYYEQDQILRNRRIPWLMPQSCFVGTDVEILCFEKRADWEKLAGLLELPDMLSRLHLPADYKINEESKKIIRQLYFEDSWLFDLYNQH